MNNESNIYCAQDITKWYTPSFHLVFISLNLSTSIIICILKKKADRVVVKGSKH